MIFIQKELLEWKKINKTFVYDFTGKMIEVKSPLVDSLVDPEHGMVWKKHPRGELIFGKAKDLLDKPGATIIPIAGFMPQDKEVKISDGLLRIIAWTVSEGSIRWIKNTPYVDIAQSKPKDIERIKFLLDKLEFSYLLKKRNKSEISKLQPYRFRIHVDGSRKITSYLKDKDNVPKWLFNLSNRQFEIFLKEYTMGDGTTYRGKHQNQKVLYGNSQKWIDYFQTMLFQNGYKSTPYWRSSPLSGKEYCQLNYQKKTFTELKSKRNVKTKQYSGKIWCINNDNGTVVARRNGKMIITQNTHDVQTFAKTTVESCKDFHTARSIGCLCNLNPAYQKNRPSKWVHGFGVAYVHPNGDYSFYNIFIVKYKFVFNDKLYKL